MQKKMKKKKMTFLMVQENLKMRWMRRPLECGEDSFIQDSRL